MRSCGGIPPRRKTRRICSRLDALVTIIAICSFHLRSFWIIKPRTLCDDTDSKAWSPTHKLLDAHTPTEVKSDWIMDGSPFRNKHSERETSSTNFQTSDFPELHYKSLTIIKKRIGPNFVPWGTPALTGNQIEIASPSLTHCLRPDRKFAVQGINDLLTLITTSFE